MRDLSTTEKIAAYEEIREYIQRTYKGEVMNLAGSLDTLPNKLVTHLTDEILRMKAALRRKERAEIRAAKSFVERVL